MPLCNYFSSEREEREANPSSVAPTPFHVNSISSPQSEMGCCNSKKHTSPPPKSLRTGKGSTGDSKSPPPTHPLHEEETVKEIHCETPTTIHKNENPLLLTTDGDISKTAAAKKHHQNGNDDEFPAPGRRSGPGYDRRSDGIGESSRRRSGFPVMYTDSWSTETGKYPGRVGSGLGDGTRKVDEGNTWPPTSNELLENPPISLECFIFL